MWTRSVERIRSTNFDARFVTFGLDPEADLAASDLDSSRDGLAFTLRGLGQ